MSDREIRPCFGRVFDVRLLSVTSRSISSSGVASRPVVVVTTIGKKVMRKVMKTRGRSLAPSVTTMIGATATMGVEWTITISG